MRKAKKEPAMSTELISHKDDGIDGGDDGWRYA